MKIVNYMHYFTTGEKEAIYVSLRKKGNDNNNNNTYFVLYQ